MPRIMQTEDSVQETWEIVTEGTIWVWTFDQRSDRYVKQRVGGRQGGSKRLHISSDDRRYNQEQIIDEMRSTDPFVSGALRLISSERVGDIDATYHLTPADLKQMFEVKDPELFEHEVKGITSELTLRRLKEVAEEYATVAQLSFISELIDERYKVGGTQRTVREMIAAGEELAGTHLS